MDNGKKKVNQGRGKRRKKVSRESGDTNVIEAETTRELECRHCWEEFSQMEHSKAT